jgi:rhodanese-related sulfurtransferase
MQEITVSTLKTCLAGSDDFCVLDVREPDEIATAHLSDKRILFISMKDVSARLADIPTYKPVYVLCRSGGRSGRITEFLNKSGLLNAVNVKVL